MDSKEDPAVPQGSDVVALLLLVIVPFLIMPLVLVIARSVELRWDSIPFLAHVSGHLLLVHILVGLVVAVDLVGSAFTLGRLTNIRDAVRAASRPTDSATPVGFSAEAVRKVEELAQTAGTEAGDAVLAGILSTIECVLQKLSREGRPWGWWVTPGGQLVKVDAFDGSLTTEHRAEVTLNMRLPGRLLRGVLLYVAGPSNLADAWTGLQVLQVGFEDKP